MAPSVGRIVPLKTVSPPANDEARRSFWNRREEVAPERAVPAKPAEPAPTPAAKTPKVNPSVQEITRSEESFRAFIGQDDPFAHGFRRTLQYIRARRPQFDNDDDFFAVVSKFVEQYPTSVRQVDAEYWSGMKAARDSFKNFPAGVWRGA